MSKWSPKRFLLGVALLSVTGLGATACGGKSQESDEPCKTGAEACRCSVNESCNEGLTCIANLCLAEGGQATGGTVSGLGGSAGLGGGAGLGGAGAGGASGAAPFPPSATGCALVTSCADCCDTVGVLAFDALGKDATLDYVKAFEVTTSTALAAFEFATEAEGGAIFFRFKEPQNIGTLRIGGRGAGGSLEVALVRANRKHGCIYPVVSGALSPEPNTCWGLGAGPYAALPADQIEVGVRSLAFGAAALIVTEVAFDP